MQAKLADENFNFTSPGGILDHHDSVVPWDNASANHGFDFCTMIWNRQGRAMMTEIVKVQIPLNGEGPALIYNKARKWVMQR